MTSLADRLTRPGMSGAGRWSCLMTPRGTDPDRTTGDSVADGVIQMGRLGASAELFAAVRAYLTAERGRPAPGAELAERESRRAAWVCLIAVEPDRPVIVGRARRRQSRLIGGPVRGPDTGRIPARIGGARFVT